jgi:hypothetical protein
MEEEVFGLEADRRSIAPQEKKTSYPLRALMVVDTLVPGCCPNRLAWSI